MMRVGNVEQVPGSPPSPALGSWCELLGLLSAQEGTTSFVALQLIPSTCPEAGELGSLFLELVQTHP